MSEEKCKGGCCSCQSKAEQAKRLLEEGGSEWKFGEGQSCPKCGSSRVMSLSRQGMLRRHCISCGWRDAVRTECA